MSDNCAESKHQTTAALDLAHADMSLRYALACFF